MRQDDSEQPALRNIYSEITWGETLRDERRLLYETGFNGKGVIREVPIDRSR